jgi:hypothetical protein
MQKKLIGMGMVAGSIGGSYLPALFHASLFSPISIITGAIGGLLGIYIGYKIGQNF